VEPGRVVVALLLDEGPILGHIVESLKDGRERNLIVSSEFFRAAGIRAMNGLANHRRSNPSPLEPQLPVIRAGTRFKVLVLRFGLGGHGSSFSITRHYTLRVHLGGDLVLSRVSLADDLL
jgi:hypothetical protein